MYNCDRYDRGGRTQTLQRLAGALGSRLRLPNFVELCAAARVYGIQARRHERAVLDTVRSLLARADKGNVRTLEAFESARRAAGPCRLSDSGGVCSTPASGHWRERSSCTKRPWSGRRSYVGCVAASGVGLVHLAFVAIRWLDCWTRPRCLCHSQVMDKSGFDVRAILAGEAPKDEPVTVKGWVRTRRDSKAGISFVHLSDGSSFHPIQVVAPSTLPNYADEVLKLTAGCAVKATGTVVPSQGKGQSFEMQASAIKVVGWVDDPDTYPIQPKPHTMEFLREVAHLRPRTNVIGAATRVRHTLAKAIHRFFDDNGFLWVNTPIITASDAEGAGALFRVSSLDLANLPRTPQGTVDFAKDFFGRESFLTVSGQLNVEAYCLALSKVYTFGPTFRAENSNTSRHLAEFWMIEPEIAFADLSDNATLAERLLKFTFETLLNEREEDLAFFDQRVEKGLVAKLEGIIASNSCAWTTAKPSRFWNKRRKRSSSQ